MQDQIQDTATITPCRNRQFGRFKALAKCRPFQPLCNLLSGVILVDTVLLYCGWCGLVLGRLKLVLVHVDKLFTSA